MASRECSTCCEVYDTGEHRVRILQCGHSQCTSCIRVQFANGCITCASCRTTHTYPDINRIPVCYIVEKVWEEMDKQKNELEKMKNEMDKLKNQETLLEEKDAGPLVPKLHKGFCDEPATFKLFWCNTHNEWICIHCSLIDHPRGDCDIISIRKKLEDDKDLLKSNISEELKHLYDTKKEIKLTIDDVERQTEEETNQIKKMNEEIDKLKKSISKKEMDIAALNSKHSKLDVILQECEKKKSTLENLMTRLHNVNTFKEVDVENETCASIIKRYENWRKELVENMEIPQFSEMTLLDKLEKLKKVTNTEEKMAMIEETKKMLQLGLKNRMMFATKTIGGTKCYGSIEQREGYIILKDLQNKSSPSTNYIVLEFDAIMAMVQANPVAFLTMEHEDSKTPLGRIHISLNGPPRRIQNFLELATASTGIGSWRAAGFDGGVYNKGRDGEYVWCQEYTTADGGTSDSKPQYDLEEGSSTLTEGAVMAEDDGWPGFAICTRTQANGTKNWPSIGQVISGLPELKAAIEKYNATDIVFSTCGVIIDGNV